jgi:hypothetical protein
MAEFDPRAIFDVLDRHGVRFVLIGGMAAILHGASHVTTDVDVVPQDSRENLERLSDALKEIHARIRVAGEPTGVPFDPSGESLMRVRVWNLQTDIGDLDITFEPAGTQGFEDLRRDAIVMHLRSGDVTVASLADVVRSKEAADRPRDRAALPGLRALLTNERSRRSTRSGTAAG